MLPKIFHHPEYSSRQRLLIARTLWNVALRHKTISVDARHLRSHEAILRSQDASVLIGLVARPFRRDICDASDSTEFKKFLFVQRPFFDFISPKVFFQCSIPPTAFQFRNSFLVVLTLGTYFSSFKSFCCFLFLGHFFTNIRPILKLL